MDFEEDIEQCLNILKEGGIILYPTETVWGIGCDATNEIAVQKIFQIKNRSDEKSMVVLLADERELLKYVTQPDLRVFDFLKQTSKPTSVVYEGAIGLADNLIGKDGSIAIRITNDPFCKHLVKRFRKPVVSTSANISDQPFPVNFNDINQMIKNWVDYIVQYRQDDQTPAAPSSVIKWNRDGTVTVLRE